MGRTIGSPVPRAASPSRHPGSPLPAPWPPGGQCRQSRWEPSQSSSIFMPQVNAHNCTAFKNSRVPLVDQILPGYRSADLSSAVSYFACTRPALRPALKLSRRLTGSSRPRCGKSPVMNARPLDYRKSPVTEEPFVALRVCSWASNSRYLRLDSSPTDNSRDC